MNSVPPAMRRQQILERIQREGGVSVADLARDLTVSSITVHRDLEQLSRDGLVERVHGGARALAAAGPATAEKGEEALTRFSGHLVRAIDEFRGLNVEVRRRAFEERV